MVPQAGLAGIGASGVGGDHFLDPFEVFGKVGQVRLRGLKKPKTLAAEAASPVGKWGNWLDGGVVIQRF